MTYWKFRAFIKSSGRNDFQEWMDSKSAKVRATIHEVMDNIIISPTLTAPHSRKLKGYQEIWELKAKIDKVQYRPLFCKGPNVGELIFLIGATKTGDHNKTKFDPINAPKTAEQRRKLIFKDGEYIGEYKRT
jgi:hypothetical protein